MITTREQDQALDALALRHGALAVEPPPSRSSGILGSVLAISTNHKCRGRYLITASGATFKQEDAR